MQIYLVGGAIRDRLLNIPQHDQDWVVVGATPTEMLSQGYQAVGRDFPVFIDPKTKQEFALARTERKTGVGYTGFHCFFSSTVTLEEDLLRRDLTINAMAQDQDGNIIDPYHGQQDLNKRILRHVSEAFIEDPLRVLRVARFAAKLAHLGFTIADETMSLMRTITQSGELEELTPERIWQEWYKSLSSNNPDIFFQVLRECGALAVIFPEIDRLFGVPQPPQWHPEIDSGIHTLLATKQAALLSDDLTVRFATQLHDLGKGITPKSEWPSHKMHCHTGIELIKKLCLRLKVPNEFRDLALVVCEHHLNIHKIEQLQPSTIIKMFNKMDVWRKPQRLEQILLCCHADHSGRQGHQQQPYPPYQQWLDCYRTAKCVDVQTIIQSGFTGQAIQNELTRQRTLALLHTSA